MKKWFGLLAVFLMSYMVFICATVPMTLLISNITLPKNVNLTGVTGTLWHAKIAQVNVGTITLQKVSADLSFMSLIALSPELKLVFGDALLASPEGKLTITLSSDKVILSDTELFVAANDIVSQLTLPLPATAQGNVTVKLENMSLSYADNNISTLKCTHATGELTWKGAGVIALENNVKLGNFKADINCKDNILTVIVDPKNNLGLSFNLYARINKHLSGDGYLKPGVKFPQALQGALPFLGKKDNQGRYRLRF